MEIIKQNNVNHITLTFQGHRSLQIKSVTRPNGGLAPIDDHNSPECQQRQCQLDEPQRQIPCEDLINYSAIGTRPREPNKFSAQTLWPASTSSPCDVFSLQVKRNWMDVLSVASLQSDLCCSLELNHTCCFCLTRRELTPQLSLVSPKFFFFPLHFFN